MGWAQLSVAGHRQLTRIYRPDGNNVEMVYASASGLLNSVIANEGAYLYEYFPKSDLVKSITAPSGQVLNYEYIGNLVTSVVASGAVSATSLNSLNEKISYDSYGQIISDIHSNGNAELISFKYSHDKNGRISSASETIKGATSQMNYVYDQDGRLTQVLSYGRPVHEYKYDQNGNRLYSKNSRGYFFATYDEQDRLLTYGPYSHKYNANGDLSEKLENKGNITKKTQFFYDAFGNLKSANLSDGKRIEYVIDGLNRRVGKKVDGRLVQGFIYQSQTQIAAELDKDGNIVKRFIYGSKINIPDYMIYQGKKYRIISNHIGTPRFIVESESGKIVEQIQLDEFGLPLTENYSSLLPFGFAGGLYDQDVKLVRFGARDYDPEVGRWTSKDPIRFDGGDTNLYGYTFSDPVNFVDPSGLRPPGQSLLCPGGNCGGNTRDQYMSGSQMNSQQIARQDAFVRGVVLTAGAAAAAPATAVAISNACLSNATLCVELITAAISGFAQGYTGDQLPYSPYGSIAEPVVETISNGVGSVCP